MKTQTAITFVVLLFSSDLNLMENFLFLIAVIKCLWAILLHYLAQSHNPAEFKH